MTRQWAFVWVILTSLSLTPFLLSCAFQLRHWEENKTTVHIKSTWGCNLYSNTASAAAATFNRRVLSLCGQRCSEITGEYKLIISLSLSLSPASSSGETLLCNFIQSSDRARHKELMQKNSDHHDEQMNAGDSREEREKWKTLRSRKYGALCLLFPVLAPLEA